MLEVTHRLGHWGPYSGPPVWSQTASSGCFSSSLTNPQGFYASSKVTSSKQAEWPQMAPLGLEGYLSHWRKRCCHYQLKRSPTNVHPPPPHKHTCTCMVVYTFPRGWGQDRHPTWDGWIVGLSCQLCALSHPKKAAETQTGKPGIAHAVCYRHPVSVKALESSRRWNQKEKSSTSR